MLEIFRANALIDATFTGYFGSVFEESSVKEITSHCFQKGFLVHT